MNGTLGTHWGLHDLKLTLDETRCFALGTSAANPDQVQLGTDVSWREDGCSKNAVPTMPTELTPTSEWGSLSAGLFALFLSLSRSSRSRGEGVDKLRGNCLEHLVAGGTGTRRINCDKLMKCHV